MRLIKQTLYRWFQKNRTATGAKISIVGLGGLGSSSAEMLARAGVGGLILIDDDKIELTNLQRQSLYDEKDIKRSKALVAQKKLQEINQEVVIMSNNLRLAQDTLYLLDSDLVLDCSDNLETGYLINRYCIDRNIPLVYCSVAGDHGLVKVITKSNGCLECLYRKPKKPESSETVGILNTAVRMGSALQVTQALKLLSHEESDDELLSFDVWRTEIKKIRVKKNPKCPACSGK